MARDDGGRRVEELLDSTGVLFRLPTADMLSMVAFEGRSSRLMEVVLERWTREMENLKQKPFRSNAPSDVNAPSSIETGLRSGWYFGTNYYARKGLNAVSQGSKMRGLCRVRVAVLVLAWLCEGTDRGM